MNRFAASKRFFASTSFLAIALIGVPGAAWAQDDQAPPTQQADDEDSDEAIVVTGSRIPRANFDTAQPAVVLGGEQIEQRGYTNLADALEELPAFGVPGSSPVGTGQAGELGSGQNFVNFFGLGDQRTLTLVNGRRFVSSNTASIFGPSAGGPGGQVDFNVIPTLLVDRIETVAVGGAPIYGSDAIAGTINIILKRDFQGFQIDAQGAISERGDASDYRIRGAAGTNFAGGRGNIAIAAEYNRTSGLDFESRPDLELNGIFTTPEDPNSPFQNVLFRDRRIPSISQNGIPQVSDQFLVLAPELAAAYGYLIGSNFFQAGVTNNGLSSGNPLVFNANGELVPLDFGSQQSPDLITTDGGNGYVLPGNLLAPTERYLGTVLAQYQLSDNIRIFAEGWYSHSKGTTFRAQPEYNSYLFGTAGGPAGDFMISLNNPFLSPSARATIQNSINNNEASDQNLFGVPQDYFYLGRANTDIISGNASSTIEVMRGVFGIDGDFRALGRDMRFELVGVYGRSETNGRGRSFVQQHLENALDTIRDASGNIVCRPGYVNAAIPTISSTCAPFNPFGNSGTNRAAADYMTAITTPRSLNTQWVVTASISGSLFDVWGGPVGFAVGYEHRHESTDFDPGAFFFGIADPDPLVDSNGDGDPTNDRTGYGQNAVFDPVSGSFDTNEFFAEVTVPLIGRDQNIPLIYSLELNGAFRWIDHSLAGSDPTYTVGATWQPIRDITFRGNFTRSVRSPAITEYFNPTSPLFAFAADPCDSRFLNDGLNPAVRQANCAAAGLPANFSSRVVGRSVTGSLSGNPNLVNEKADAWTVGAVIRPRFLPNLTVAVDWVDIVVNDAVTALTGTNIMEACYDSADYPNSISASGTNFCDLFTRNATPGQQFGQVTFLELQFDNAARRRFRGLISEIQYRIDTPFLGATSSVTLGVNYLYNNRLDLQVGTSDLTTLDTSIGYSKHQFTANATYRNAGFSWQWQAQYIGPALVDPDAADDTYEFPGNGSIVLFNSSMSYNINDRLRLNFVVDNVFDTSPPFPVPAAGGTVTYFDAIRGRFFRFGAGIRF